MKYIITSILITVLFAYQSTEELDYLVGKTANPKNKLNLDTQQDFDRMQKAALKDGIHLKVVSGYRSFTRQKQIWTRKYKKYKAQGLSPDAIFDKIVEYSTVPGTSRHHWGTDIDIIDSNATYSGDVLVPSKFHGNGPFCKMKDWMDEHANTYGFELVYTFNDHRTGFKYEPWHYSHKDGSVKILKDYLKHIDLVEFLKKENIIGMNEISKERIDRYLEEHIKGINPELL